MRVRIPRSRRVITTQIDAFGRDDAAQAESFASEGIKSKFPDATSFLGMVKQSFPALVHPRSTHFEPTMTSDSGTVQKVTVVDANGGVWTARLHAREGRRSLGDLGLRLC